MANHSRIQDQQQRPVEDMKREDLSPTEPEANAIPNSNLNETVTPNFEFEKNMESSNAYESTKTTVPPLIEPTGEEEEP